MSSMQPALAPAPHPMRPPPQENAAEQSLREQLLATVRGPHPTLKGENLHSSAAGNPRDQNIDPAIAGTGIMNASAGESGGDESGTPESRKGGKRELSTSKRAAQNRAAQRAFRQRKEGHIKELEEQVKNYNTMAEINKALQAENYGLRDYIINLQSRLLESQGEFPQPPSNIELPHPRAPGQPNQQIPAPTAPMGSSAVSQLQASAALADMGGNKQSHKDNNYLTTNPPSQRPSMSDSASAATQISGSNP